MMQEACVCLYALIGWQAGAGFILQAVCSCGLDGDTCASAGSGCACFDKGVSGPGSHDT